MADGADKLRRAARQLIQTDLLMGGDFMPARRNPLPAPAQPAPVPGAGATAAPSPPGEPPVKPGAPVHGPVTQAQAGRIPTLYQTAAGAQGESAAKDASALGPAAPMSREGKAAALNEIDVHEVRPCVKCRLHAGRTQTVFGEGAADAALMFVGEGPGEEEDRQGRPFVGRAGQKLNDMIAAMGLRREQVYIANVVKCRPPGNRTPLPDEAATCSGLYLWRQIAIIRPKAIVTLGNPATQALLGAVQGITKIRGRWQKLRRLAEGLEGIPVMPTFHPAYLLRQYTPENRKAVWDDLQKVMEFLGLKKK